jgi:hypothetical protein
MALDKLGKEFKVGQVVVKAYGTGHLELHAVTKIVDDKVYLGKSRNPLVYPQCVLILAG